MLIGLGLRRDSPHLKQHKGRRERWDLSVGTAGHGGDVQQFILPKLSEASGTAHVGRTGLSVGSV